jgi:DNA-binding LacI/PurR family transcriptional regulator
VVNGGSDVSAKTYKKVMAAIEEIGYRPNAIARSLATSRSRTIGLFVTDFAQGFFPDTTHTIEQEAAKHGYAVYIATPSDNAIRIRSALERLRDDRFSGVIVNTSSSGYEPELQHAAREGFPIVLIHDQIEGVPAAINWPGFRSGAKLAVDHLVSLGRRRIAFMATRNDTLIDRDKLVGYREALDQAGLEFDSSLVIKCSRAFSGGFDAMGDLLLANPDIDAVFSASDIRAVGALRYLSTKGISVPDRIAIVAFGNSTLATMVTPSLSTVNTPRSEMGKVAVQSLLEMLDGKPAITKYVHEQPVLVLGESSIPAMSGQEGRRTLD